ncbi:CorA family divalent cation transporter [Kribbella turkmenica]|uniref:CorA family divalent cation transporter n=1 Tax=Kribbella turkmenica TaxID=2530375 RepID=UPI001F45528C|nr:CorA family divalent cation transporter [Kribbella turkmenica]
MDGYEGVAAAVEVDVDEVESSVFSPERTSDAERIYKPKREVMEMRRAVGPLKEPLEAFSHGTVPLVSREAAPFFRDVVDHVVRVSVQQNDDMRRISAWVAIAAVPTALAGIWGMNFENMPELKWHFGYFAVTGLTTGCCVVMYAPFRRAWLAVENWPETPPG